MNWRTVRTLVMHELRMLMRDRRTVILSIVLPLVVMPLMIFGTTLVQERREEKLDETVYQYTVTGTEAKKLRSLITRGLKHAKLQADESDLSTFKYEELPVASPDSSLKARDLHFYLEALSGAEADSIDLHVQQEDDVEVTSNETVESYTVKTIAEIRFPGVSVVNIYFQADRDASREGQDKMWRLLRLTRKTDREAALRASGLPVNPQDVMSVESNNVATAGQMTGSLIGRMMPVILVFLMLTGGSVAALDSIAGEKERGSLETLLTTSVQRVEIIASKQLTILSVALVITIIQVVNLLCYLTFRVIELPDGFIVDVPPATLALLLLLFIPVASLVSSALLMISAYAKSFKETQMYYLPVFLFMLVLTAASFLPGISLRSAIAVVPLANVSVAVREVMVGSYDWPMLFITFAVMALAAAWMIRASAGMLSMERLITASEVDEADLVGGPALFPKHVVRWYAVMWALLFAVAANIPQLATFERQLLFNEFVIFIGAPALILWKYRLNIKEALALRPVKLIVWPIILLLIPAVQLTGTGVFYLANFIFPVPERMLEAFSRQIFPEDMSVWLLFIYIAIIPGICEEIGFRGTLLYGLRRRFHPIVLALVIGAIFGIFHIALFRIIPTGFLGVVLTGVALLTGSIFPCMLLHIGNNGFALWMSKHEITMAGLDWWHYLIGTVAFAGCMYLLYRHRTPYPDLRQAMPAKTK